MKFIYQETDPELYLKILVLYLDNPSEKALFESNHIKE